MMRDPSDERRTISTRSTEAQAGPGAEGIVQISVRLPDRGAPSWPIGDDSDKMTRRHAEGGVLDDSTPLRTTDPGPLTLSKDGRAIASMFDRIAPRYDLLNHLLSLGIDRRWRRALVEALANVRTTVLDVCTGTGDVALTIRRQRPDLRIVGLDFAKEMVRLGDRKARAEDDRTGAGPPVRFGVADAMRLSVRDASVGAVTVAFGIRNVSDAAGTLAEFHRVLEPGGRVAVLEFSRPRAPVVRQAYWLYFRHVLPRVGRIVSGVGGAYRYLPESVMAFPEGEDFLDLLGRVGFRNVAERRLTLGIATLYTGDR